MLLNDLCDATEAFMICPVDIAEFGDLVTELETCHFRRARGCNRVDLCEWRLYGRDWGGPRYSLIRGLG
jgi:hypothetical protein